MEKIIIEEEYPCGYKAKLMKTKFNLLNLLFPTMKVIEIRKEGCPLHGKKCKRK